MTGDGQNNLNKISLLSFLLPLLLTSALLFTGILQAQPAVPSLFLWAWERPEDLGFIDSSSVGVAYLAGTIRLENSDVFMLPRLQPLKLPDRTYLIGVVRIETRRADLSADQRLRSVREIIRFLPFDRLQGLQIDFDASVSERSFYRALLSDLRASLPESLALSITALASWCTWDDWLSDLPLQEAVPMLFRMGKDARQVIIYLQKKQGFGVKKCRESVGISTDEPIQHLPPCERTYIFNPRPWSDKELNRMIKEVRQWQEKQ